MGERGDQEAKRAVLRKAEALDNKVVILSQPDTRKPPCYAGRERGSTDAFSVMIPRNYNTRNCFCFLLACQRPASTAGLMMMFTRLLLVFLLIASSAWAAVAADSQDSTAPPQDQSFSDKLKGLLESAAVPVAGAVGGTVVGAGVGVAAVGAAAALIGLTPLGPVAGGLFAAHMGPGLAAGGWMAAAQAAVATGTAYTTGAALLSAAGGVVGAAAGGYISGGADANKAHDEAEPKAIDSAGV